MSTQPNQIVSKFTLKRTLNKTRSLSLIIGSVLGSGLMILPGLVYRDIGIVSFYSWLGMGLFILPFLYIFTKLVIKFPSAGGIVNVVHQVLGPKISSSISYLTLFAMIIVVPVVAVIGANYIGYLFSLTSRNIIFVAAVMLIGSTLINIFDTNIVLKIQGFSATILLVLLFLIIGTSTKVALPQFITQVANVDLFTVKTYYYIGMGMVIVFWAFLGWENLSFTTEEFTDIRRDLPGAVIASFLIMMILYLGLSLSVIGILSPDTLHTVQAPLAEVINKTLGNRYGQLVAIIGTLIMIINLNAWVWGPSRLLYDCGRKGILPKAFGRLSKYRTPVLALVILLLFYYLILCYMFVNQAGLNGLIKLANANFMTLYLLTIISFLKLAKKRFEVTLGILALCFTIVMMAFYGLYILFPLVLLSVGIIKGLMKPNYQPKEEG